MKVFENRDGSMENHSGFESGVKDVHGKILELFCSEVLIDTDQLSTKELKR